MAKHIHVHLTRDAEFSGYQTIQLQELVRRVDAAAQAKGYEARAADQERKTLEGQAREIRKELKKRGVS